MLVCLRLRAASVGLDIPLLADEDTGAIDDPDVEG